MQNIPENMFEPASANAGDAEKINKKAFPSGKTPCSASAAISLRWSGSF